MADARAIRLTSERQSGVRRNLAADPRCVITTDDAPTWGSGLLESDFEARPPVGSSPDA